MNCNTTHYRANSSSVPGDPTFQARPPRPHRPRHSPTANPPYALDPSPFNPSWPSILSVAHDVADGAALWLITDRPVVYQFGTVFGLPLSVDGAWGGPLSVLAVTQTLPYKWRLALSGPVPAGAAWRWGATGVGDANFYDPVTNHPLNAAGGVVADAVGPYAPPAAATVVSATADSSPVVRLQFDQPVNLLGQPSGDGSIDVNGMQPTAAALVDGYTLALTVASPVFTGAAWGIVAQPGWVESAIAAPQNGTF